MERKASVTIECEFGNWQLAEAGNAAELSITFFPVEPQAPEEKGMLTCEVTLKFTDLYDSRVFSDSFPLWDEDVIRFANNLERPGIRTDILAKLEAYETGPRLIARPANDDPSKITIEGNFQYAQFAIDCEPDDEEEIYMSPFGAGATLRFRGLRLKRADVPRIVKQLKKALRTAR